MFKLSCNLTGSKCTGSMNRIGVEMPTARSLREWRGTTLSSWSAVKSMVGGYCTPLSFSQGLWTLWIGENLYTAKLDQRCQRYFVQTNEVFSALLEFRKKVQSERASTWSNCENLPPCQSNHSPRSMHVLEIAKSLVNCASTLSQPAVVCIWKFINEQSLRWRSGDWALSWSMIT